MKGNNFYTVLMIYFLTEASPSNSLPLPAPELEINMRGQGWSAPGDTFG